MTNNPTTREEDVDTSNLIKSREFLYRLIISQLFYDGHQSIGTNLTSAVQADPPCAPSDRLFHIVLAGLEHEPDRKERPPNPGIGNNNVGPGLDLEFETESNIPAPEPALYETAYVTSHKGNCRAGCFSNDGQLIATGSVDASIKILDVDRMLAKSAPDEMDPSRGEQQGHPVIRTLYDHMEEVTCLEFHPKEPILLSGSKDNSIKMFDISKASVKKAFKTISSAHSEKLNQLPEKSRSLYEKTYSHFITWCENKGQPQYTESVFLSYFAELVELGHIGSLWPKYSMLKSTLQLHNNLEISKYNDLVQFIKRSIEGHQPKKSKVLEKEHVLNFLNGAPNESFLMIKESEAIRAMSFHPGGDHLIVATTHPVIRLYDVNTLQCYVCAFPTHQHTQTVTCLKWSGDARVFASCSKDGSIKLWDGVSNRCINTFQKAHDGLEVCSVAFSKNGKYLLSSGKNSICKLWELTTSRCLIAYTGAGTTGKQEYEAQAVFNHTEDYVLFPDEATTSLCAWNSRNASRKQLMSLGHNGAVRLIAHSPTQAAFLTCSDDFRARFWYRRTPTL